ncbi:MAG: flagellar hook protein FlgE [Methylomonas sp.]|jgi:flagellar hook protein FlgE
MTFATALSGLNAASNDLSVTGNNIANVNTDGFKQSVSEFSDVYASSIAGVSSITPGSGVSVANDAQQFSQGILQGTNNNLDMAISGGGFFTLAQSPTNTNDLSYSRDGEFELDQNGYLVNNQGNAVMAYAPNGATVAAGFSTGVLQPIKIDTLTGPPTPTSTINLNVNLNASNSVPSVTPFSPTNPSSYNSQTSATIYDSLGTPHIITTYFVNAGSSTDTTGATVTDWQAYHYISDPATPTAQTPLDATSIGSSVSTATIPTATATTPVPGDLTFDSSGNLISPTGGDFSLETYTVNPPTGAAPITISDMNYSGSTQVQQAFSVNGQTQNGLPAGQLTGVSIDDTGVISANFSNGGTLPLGQVALSNFANVNGLSKIGSTSWKQSSSSGPATLGTAGSGSLGTIQSGSVETSNVNLSNELVNLIVAQQAYQANAKTITTENNIMTSILQIQ